MGCVHSCTAEPICKWLPSIESPPSTHSLYEEHVSNKFDCRQPHHCYQGFVEALGWRCHFSFPGCFSNALHKQHMQLILMMLHGLKTKMCWCAWLSVFPYILELTRTYMMWEMFELTSLNGETQAAQIDVAEYLRYVVVVVSHLFWRIKLSLWQNLNCACNENDINFLLTTMVLAVHHAMGQHLRFLVSYWNTIPWIRLQISTQIELNDFHALDSIMFMIWSAPAHRWYHKRLHGDCGFRAAVIVLLSIWWHMTQKCFCEFGENEISEERKVYWCFGFLAVCKYIRYSVCAWNPAALLKALIVTINHFFSVRNASIAL